MPQTVLSYIQVFDRANYPAAVGSAAPNVLETISVFIDPKFSEIENKASEFFKFKPRRFEFSVRLSDTTYLDTELTPHTNYPNLSEYMLRAFDSSDNQIFEGIIAIENSINYNDQTVEITAYDPLVLIVDTDARYNTAQLQASYTDPELFQALLMNTAINLYFITGNKPTFDVPPTWTVKDWGYGNYRDMYDFTTLTLTITQFYSDINTSYKDAARAEFRDTFGSDTITDIYDYSKIEIHRGGQYHNNAIFAFIGCIVFHNSNINKNYIVVYYNGAYFDARNGEFYAALDDNMDTPLVYDNAGGANTFSHRICEYFSNRIYHAYTTIFTPSGDDYLYQLNAGFFNIVYYANLFDALGKEDFLTATLKAQINARDTPQWRVLSGGENYREDVTTYGSAESYHRSKGTNYLSIFGIKDEAGDYVKNEFSNGVEEDYLYEENSNSVWRGTDYTFRPSSLNSEEVTMEDGIFDLRKSTVLYDDVPLVPTVLFHTYTAFKFHVNYNEAYPLPDLIDDGRGIGVNATLHKVGNISRVKGYLPSNITYAPYSGATEYYFDVPTSGQKWYSVAKLLKFFLASMNLYCYYYQNLFRFIDTFAANPGTITVDDADVVGWKTQTNEKTYIDASEVLLPTLNYTGNSLNPEYNKIAALDVNRASCKISRVFDSLGTYDAITINSYLSVRSATWRVDKANVFNAYIDVNLTKYTSDPL